MALYASSNNCCLYIDTTTENLWCVSGYTCTAVVSFIGDLIRFLQRKKEEPQCFVCTIYYTVDNGRTTNENPVVVSDGVLQTVIRCQWPGHPDGADGRGHSTPLDGICHRLQFFRTPWPKTTERTHNFYESTARHFGIAVLQNSISRHFHAGRGCAQNQLARISSTGMV